MLECRAVRAIGNASPGIYFQQARERIFMPYAPSLTGVHDVSMSQSDRRGRRRSPPRAGLTEIA